MKTLWSIHIPGPDEYHADPSEEIAKYMAARHTTAMQAYVADNKLDWGLEMISAEVAEWPGTAEDHAEDVSEFDYAAWGLEGGAA
jgi:hypothetical protein